MTVFSVYVDDNLIFTWTGDLAGLRSDFLDLMSSRGEPPEAFTFARNTALVLADDGFPDDPCGRALYVEALTYFTLELCRSKRPGSIALWTAEVDFLELEIWHREEGGFRTAAAFA